jgi:hypothetical protein
MSKKFHIEKYVDWMQSSDVRPYVYVRADNKIAHPGKKHRLDWFKYAPVHINPLDIHELEFAEQIYFLETNAFGPANMAMPRWVFYDCAVMPGFVAGFAMRTSVLPESIKKIMRYDENQEWTPLSLFIIIPTMAKGEWVAHNLCSVNSLLPEGERLYGLGFLTKAFGLWYANVETCCGMTQWGAPALKLHSHYGHLEVLTSYTPVHSHAKTITYRVDVNTHLWEQFFTKEPDILFQEKYEPSGLELDPTSVESMIDLQHRLERGDGPFFLSAAEIARKKLTESQTVYRPR